jgi:hypothetical protein
VAYLFQKVDYIITVDDLWVVSLQRVIMAFSCKLENDEKVFKAVCFLLKT